MLIIQKDQRELLLCDLRGRQAGELAQTIKHELRSQAPDILQSYDEGQIDTTIPEVINRCWAKDIVDEDQILNLCYIRFNTNVDIFSNPAFSYILDEPLMHPYAKGRHLVLSFYSILAMKKGT